MPISTINNKSIADGTVIAADILDGTISTSKLVAANIAGDRIAANTLANSVFQTGSVENYLNSQSGGALSGRNKIINGAMVIDQRNAGAALTPTDGQYTVDRWKGFASQSSKYTIQQDSSSNTVSGFTSSLKVTSSSSYSVGSSDYFAVVQLIEGYNVADLDLGKNTAKNITISFWVRSSLTGTFGGALNNSGSSRSYPFTYTIVAANTWEQKFITIAGDTSGTWLTTNGVGLAVLFGLGVGSTYSGTAGSWASANYVSATGATSVVGTNAATWYVTGVQLEKGSQATPFEYRNFTNEFALCQRYYETNVSYGIVPANGNAGMWYCSSTPNTVYPQGIGFAISKRTAPTMTFYRDSSNGSSDNIWHYYSGSAWVSLGSQTATARTGAFWTNSNVSPTQHASWLIAGIWTASAEL